MGPGGVVGPPGPPGPRDHHVGPGTGRDARSGHGVAQHAPGSVDGVRHDRSRRVAGVDARAAGSREGSRSVSTCPCWPMHPLTWSRWAALDSSVGRALIERRLRDVSERMKKVVSELAGRRAPRAPGRRRRRGSAAGAVSEPRWPGRTTARRSATPTPWRRHRDQLAARSKSWRPPRTTYSIGSWLRPPDRVPTIPNTGEQRCPPVS